MTSAGPDVSLGQMFLTHAARVPDRPAYRVNVAGALVEVSYSDARRRVESVAAGLLTIPGGLPAGAAVGIFANTRVEWLLSDFAALCVGAITVPVYASLLAPEVGYIHVDAAIEVCIVEGKAQLDKVRAIRDGFSFLEQRYTKDQIKLRHIVVMDPAGIEPAADWESFAALEERGRNQLGATSALRAERLATTKRDDVATYTYTSGTTGAPKGVIQTHGNWLSTLEIAADLGIFTDRTRISGVFLFLPLAHAFGRMMGFGGPFFDAVVVLASVDTLLDDLARSRPGFVPSSPRMYEKMYAKIMSGVAGAPKHRQALFNWALDCGKRTLPYRQRGRRLPPLLAAEHKLADRLVLSQIRARLGLDRCDVMLTGASPIARAVHEFFMASGLTLIEAYGMTETTPGISANVPGKWKLGTVGPLLRHVKLKFDVDGEICVKGPSITRGYLNRPDANADAFDRDGWLHTGDIGEMDAEGFLRITDRKKDLIKTSGGKIVAPQKIEGLLKGRPLIAEAVVVGDNLKFCSALLVVDEDALQAWAKRTGNAAQVRAPKTLAFLQEQIDAVNRDLASFESIKYFRVIEDQFTIDNGLLTASYKVKRKVVNQRYAHLIEEMYGAQASGRTAA